jgi:hypothetical protein
MSKAVRKIPELAILGPSNQERWDREIGAAASRRKRRASLFVIFAPSLLLFHSDRTIGRWCGHS